MSQATEIRQKMDELRAQMHPEMPRQMALDFFATLGALWQRWSDAVSWRSQEEQHDRPA